MKKYLLCYAVLLLACAELSVTDQYQAAVNDAAIVKPKDINHQLWAIHSNNPHLIWNADKTKVLVVTWKSVESFEKYLKNKTKTDSDINHALWVTAVPQIKNFCSTIEKDDLDLRLKQYLGLAPDWSYQVFVELWVSPEALFRPCVDTEITDTECQIEIPKNFTNTEQGQFYQQQYFKSFRASVGVPWTGLGYTYDWGNAGSKIGASEFILKPNADYQIKQVQTTRAYCAN